MSDARQAISAEAHGLLRALTALGAVRHFDDVAEELVSSGLAQRRGSRLVITDKGRGTKVRVALKARRRKAG